MQLLTPPYCRQPPLLKAHRQPLLRWDYLQMLLLMPYMCQQHCQYCCLQFLALLVLQTVLTPLREQQRLLASSAVA